MPKYHPVLNYIDIEETRRYAGLASARDFNEQLLYDACSEAQILVYPQAIWSIYPYDAANGEILAPNLLALSGKSIKKHLADSLQVVVLAVTIGEALEAAISKYFSSGRYTAALLLDAAGTAAVEATADKASSIISQQAQSNGLTTLWRFSPGYGDWDITVQPQIHMLAQGENIGISVTESCMLTPRKSVTALIGLVPNANEEQKTLPACEAKTCQSCSQLNCIARRESK